MTTAASSPPLMIRQAGPSDAALFASLAESTFVDTFGAHNTRSDMACYLGEAFGEDVQREELRDARNTVLFAEQGDTVVGYAMLRTHNAPPCVTDHDAMEIARLYAVSDVIGKGVGAALMQRCLEVAAEQGHHTVWLGVWERNPRAIAFYERWGFVDVGAKAFVLGSDHQTDRVMIRAAGMDRSGDACDIR